MVALLFLACAFAAAPNAEDFLLARAHEAAAKGDRGALTELLRGWATLGPRGGLPVGLEKEAAEALAWADGVGRFRLFASRLEDRVRVGVYDPAALAARIDAFAVVNGETLRITRAADEVSDRLEFRIDAVDAPVIVEAVMTRFGTDVVLARAELAPNQQAALPPAPDKNAFQRRKHKTEDVSVEPDQPTPWWLIAAGAAAALLAGAAVWQETRF
jgi:hypothetical protein